MSAVSIMSLTPTGIPCSGPRGSSAVALARLRQRRLGIEVRPRAQLALARLDPLEARRHELLRAQLALPRAAGRPRSRSRIGAGYARPMIR